MCEIFTDTRESLVSAIAAYDREIAHPEIYEDMTNG